MALRLLIFESLYDCWWLCCPQKNEEAARICGFLVFKHLNDGNKPNFHLHTATALERLWQHGLPRLAVDHFGWRVRKRLVNPEVQSDAKLRGCKTVEAKLPLHFVRLLV